MNHLCGKDFLTGPFDSCVQCSFLGNGCSGPRTSAMQHERYVEWIREIKKLRDYTNQEIADGTGLSKATVDDIIAGRRKDISRTTAGLLEDFLIGGNAKWPCAMKLAEGKEIVYEDRPETLEALKVRAEQVENLRKNYAEVRDSVDRELERVRKEYEDEIKFFRERIDFLTNRIGQADEMIKRKDDYIDRLAKKLGL